MHFKRLQLAGAVLITPPIFEDERGSFMETYSDRNFAEAIGDIAFVQDNYAVSRKRGTLRGLHFQLPPMAQAKLVRVVKGAIIDVGVDLRAESPTYLQHVLVELSASNRAQLYVPAGLAHGYVTLEDDTHVAYKVDAHYSPKHERSVLWSDPDLAIDWQLGGAAPIVAQKDAVAPLVNEIAATLPKAWS